MSNVSKKVDEITRKMQVYEFVKSLALTLGIPFPDAMVKMYIMRTDINKINAIIEKTREWIKHV